MGLGDFEEIRGDLYRLGFNLSMFGNRTVMIEGFRRMYGPEAK